MTRRQADQVAVARAEDEIDIRDVPAYGTQEAARYLHIPAATRRSWVFGRTYPRGQETAEFEPLIRLPDPESHRLSFNNLIEAHVLRALRTRHSVEMRSVRPALAYAEGALQVDRLLLSDRLRTAGGDLFLERFGELINLSRSGQMALRRVLDAYLRRVDRDERHLPVRLFPFLTGDLQNGRTIVIDPSVSFGHPTVAGSGVSTSAIVDRIDAGESVTEVATDYGLTNQQVEDAVLYERAA